MRIRGARTAENATAAAVSRLLPQLVPAAVLLTDDQEAAVDLLVAALSARRALEDPDRAWRVLAGPGVRRPRWSVEQVIESTEPDARTDDDATLAAALLALPDRDRAAVVLGILAAPPAAQVGGESGAAAVGRLQEDLARRDREERRERGRMSAPYRLPGSAATAEQPADPLPERLARLAAGRPLPPASVQTIAAEVTAARAARRRRGLRIAAGAVVAGLLVSVMPLLPQRAPAQPTVYGQPTRGTLAGNGDFVAAMAAAAWPGAPGASASRRVVFADDVPGGRWALVAAGGGRSAPAAVAWFTGPSGAAADGMVLRSVRTAPDPSLPVSLTDPATGALVVVGAPGDRMTLSTRPEVDADGAVTRSFQRLVTSGGVAVKGLPPIPYATENDLRLRVTRGDRHLDVPPPSVLADPSASVVDVPVTALRPAAAPSDGDPAVQARLRSLLGRLGEPLAGTPITALWSGDLPGANDRPTRLTVLAVEEASGAFVVTAPYGYAADAGGRTGSSWCATGVLPAGPPLEQRAVAVRCDLSDLTVRGEISRFLVVVGPRTAASVQLLDDDGALLSTHALDDGVAVIRSPGDVAEVSVLTADGAAATATPFVDPDL